MTLPALLMGMDKWMNLLLMGPQSVRDELLGKCSEFFRKEIAAYRAAGADVLVYSNPFGSTDFVPMRFIEETSLPWMAQDLRDGMDGVVFYGGSARFNKVIDVVARRMGFRSFFLSPLDDVAEGKRAVAGRGLTGGVINDIPLIDESPQEIRAEVKRLMDAGKPGGQFCFGTLAMPLAIPEQSIHAMLDAAYEYGRLDAP
jgi:uroporphyrinogen decarboxylase